MEDSGILKKQKVEEDEDLTGHYLEIVSTLVIPYIPCLQWFLLSKKISTIAKDYISPADHRKKDKGALVWATKRVRILFISSRQN
jgi:hypothetical protein